MSDHVPVYDTGMLLALIRRQPEALVMHTGLLGTVHRPVVLGPVLAQAWRPHPATMHALGRMLRECHVPLARGSAPSLRKALAGDAACMHCETAPDLDDWRRIGAVLGSAALPPKKAPDAVDASVAFTAARHRGSVIFTSDPDDLTAYLDAFGAEAVHLVRI